MHKLTILRSLTKALQSENAEQAIQARDYIKLLCIGEMKLQVLQGLAQAIVDNLSEKDVLIKEIKEFDANHPENQYD